MNKIQGILPPERVPRRERKLANGFYVALSSDLLPDFPGYRKSKRTKRTQQLERDQPTNRRRQVEFNSSQSHHLLPDYPVYRKRRKLFILQHCEIIPMIDKKSKNKYN